MRLLLYLSSGSGKGLVLVHCSVLLTLQVTKDNGTSGELTGEMRSRDLCEHKEVVGQARLQMGVDTK